MSPAFGTAVGVTAGGVTIGVGGTVGMTGIVGVGVGVGAMMLIDVGDEVSCGAVRSRATPQSAAVPPAATTKAATSATPRGTARATRFPRRAKSFRNATV
ncbi:MAG: hypothetical protein JWQ64_2272 [Subtercola sp.]|nr:hypothetical protein [Subtercola sp.]